MPASEPHPQIIGARRVGAHSYEVTLRDQTGVDTAYEIVRRGGLIPAMTVSDALMAAVGDATWIARGACLLVQHLDDLSTQPPDRGLRAQLTFQDAVQIADDVVRAMPQDSHEVVLAGCTEFASAWVFTYQTRAALDGDLVASLAGTGPVVVPKNGSAPWLASPARPVEQQIPPAGGAVP